MVAGGEGGLSEARDGEILFFGVCAEGCAVVRFFEDCYGALDWFDCLVGDACACRLADDQCKGRAASLQQAGWTIAL